MGITRIMAALLFTSACASGAGVIGGGAGCISYGEARLSMPDANTVPGGKWGEWIADTDDRMTGACR